MFWDKTSSNGRASDDGDDATTVDESELPSAEVDVDDVGVNSEVRDDQSDREEWFRELKGELHRETIAKIDLSALSTMTQEDLRRDVRRAANELLHGRSDLLNRHEQDRLIEEVIDEIFGLGPLEPIFRDTSVTDILINGAHTVYVERRGRLELTNISFVDDRHLVHIIQRIVSAVGRRIDETSPMCDARLSDGSRVNAIIPPLAIDGPLVSIRRFGAKALDIDDLLANESIAPAIVEFLEACVKARLNVLISGGTGSGKTTLLNALSSFIPHDERVATIEDAAELQLQQRHVVRMETRPANVEGKGEVTTRDLVRNALRMRPDRIVVGECRGAEALDMLQAMNTGHDGSLTTIHANSARDAVSRLEMMVGMAGFELPVWTVRRQIASAVHIVVQAARLTGGRRKVINVAEITGMEGDVLIMHDLFTFKQTGVDDDHNACGYSCSTGIRPQNIDRLRAAGVPVPVELFEQRILG